MRIIQKDNITNPFISPSGEVIYEMIGSANSIGGTKNHSVAHVTLSAGKSSNAHYHKISEETYYILSGKANMIIDNQSFSLEPGQACLIMPNEVHQIFNNSKDSLEFLAICAPAFNNTDSYFL